MKLPLSLCHWASYPNRKHEICWGNVVKYDEAHTESQAVFYYTCEGHKDVDDGGKYKEQPKDWERAKQ
jgi:hypothetical protein